jgi:hypothetical protein
MYCVRLAHVLPTVINPLLVIPSTCDSNWITAQATLPYRGVDPRPPSKRSHRGYERALVPVA